MKIRLVVAELFHAMIWHVNSLQSSSTTMKYNHRLQSHAFSRIYEFPAVLVFQLKAINVCVAKTQLTENHFTVTKTYNKSAHT